MLLYSLGDSFSLPYKITEGDIQDTSKGNNKQNGKTTKHAIHEPGILTLVGSYSMQLNKVGDQLLLVFCLLKTTIEMSMTILVYMKY